ncbi:MAG: hypothetical protein HOV77_14645 [Hamadaea sp.]|uniref:hypothetical protein n=1 Tax=Hamadaea sp. TaxID=2024425 RepID=UPI00184CD20C|nr:hypothetical protein [Hamadaea sp.]NUT20422.1 hypothetical protein [Hamadaea sp.]
MIELGIPEDHEPGSAPAPPWLRGWGVRRPLVALAAAAICLALLGAAAPAAPGTPIHRVDGIGAQDAYQVVGDVLVTYHWGPSSRLTAFDLASGVRLWQRDLPLPLGGTESIGDLLIVVTAPEMPDPESPTPAEEAANLAASTVTAYAVGSGEVRWSRPGALYGSIESELLLIRPPGPQAWLEAAEPATGTTRWRRPLAPPGNWMVAWYPANGFGGYADNLVELSADGTVTLIDVKNGGPTGAGHVPPGGSLAFAWNGVLGIRYGPVTPADGGGVERRLDIYDIKTGFTRLWTAQIPTSDMSPCGPDLLCDWSSSGEKRFVLRTGEDVTAREATRQSVLDRLQSARMAIWNVLSMDDDRSLVFISPSPGQAGWLGQFDANDPELQVTPLIHLPGPIDQCSISELWLVCSDSNEGRAIGDGHAYAIRRADLAAAPGLRPTRDAD